MAQVWGRMCPAVSATLQEWVWHENAGMGCGGLCGLLVKLGMHASDGANVWAPGNKVTCRPARASPQPGWLPEQLFTSLCPLELRKLPFFTCACASVPCSQLPLWECPNLMFALPWLSGFPTTPPGQRRLTGTAPFLRSTSSRLLLSRQSQAAQGVGALLCLAAAGLQQLEGK